MACKTETKEIDDREYSVTQWPVENSLTMKLKLMKAIGPALAKLASSANQKDDDIQGLSESLSSLFENSSPEELVALMKQCLVGVAVEGKRMTETSFNEVFSPDDLMSIYKVFVFVLQVNYGNFLKGQLVENLLAKAKDQL
jgi:hypothetical protein